MKGGVIIAVIALLWLAYKFFLADKVKGETVEIKPFRSNSKLEAIGSLTVKLEEIEREGNYMWFIYQLNEKKQIGSFSFDYVKIRPKRVDDNFNHKKGVIAHVLVGNTASSEPPIFIDWGLVKVVN